LLKLSTFLKFQSAFIALQPSLASITFMPSPGDRANLKDNLETLAELRSKPRGSRLTYDKTRARFSIQEPGIRQSLSRDQIENEEYFGTPLRELFAAAYAENHQDLNRALNGLRHLTEFYHGDKLRTLEAVIEDAELGMRKDPAHAVNLRERYAKYVTFGFAQSMFLPHSNGGVCYSLTVHWARRILMGKTFFGVSEDAQNEEVRLLTLNRAQKVRMRNKFRKVQPLHAALKAEGLGTEFGNAFMIVARGNERLRKYSNINILAAGNRQPIQQRERGSEIMTTIMTAAGESGYRVFLVSFSKDQEGHTIGIHRSGILHFFDPNLGEFSFPKGSNPGDVWSFLDDWWETFYTVRRVNYYTHWDLEGARLRPQQQQDAD
jgi:hypothetical protein